MQARDVPHFVVDQIVSPYRAHIEALQLRIKRLEAERSDWVTSSMVYSDAQTALDYSPYHDHITLDLRFPEYRYRVNLDRPIDELRDFDGFVKHLYRRIMEEVQEPMVGRIVDAVVEASGKHGKYA